MVDFPEKVIADLQASGLVPEDLGIRMAGGPEKAATGTPYSTLSYVIPYYDIHGKAIPFYRAKLFDHDVKYLQPKDTSNHVYFPKRFMEVAKTKPYIVITEGEKKAAALVKVGIPCIAFGGTESWRNRAVLLPKDVELVTEGDMLRAKLPAFVGGAQLEDMTSQLAIGMIELMDFIIDSHKTVIICYDTDGPKGVAAPVQRAAAVLGHELRFRGVPFAKIRQAILPYIPTLGTKIGVDDFLVRVGALPLEAVFVECLKKRFAFPRYPNVKDYLNKKLQKGKLSRKELQGLSIAVLSELDANGMRLRSKSEEETYYFDSSTHKLMKVILSSDVVGLPGTPFGQYLYSKFGLGIPDARALQWLDTQFTGEEPVLDVTPHRILARPDFNVDNVTFQLSDGDYCIISGSDGSVEGDREHAGLTVVSNGSNNVLFEAGHVEPIDVAKFKAEYAKLVAEYENQPQIPLKSYWMDVLSEVRLKDKTKQRTVTAMLFYISPWLYRWRGAQLPIEVTIGEAGSGKSSLQELRLQIMTGVPKLRNAPTDIKDWHASVTNTGGLHVTDNLVLSDKTLRQRLSDEICRIITEPFPTIEMRKYYTHSDLVQIPVRCVFGVTAIQQPFLNADILQRAILIELDKYQDLRDGQLNYDSSWKSQQLGRYGGRESWLAHHMYVLHRFFQLVAQKWDHRYKAQHRLIHFEQAMCLMAEVFGIPNQWIPSYLSGVTQDAVVHADTAFEGVMEFASYWALHEAAANKGTQYFTAQDLSNWAMGNPDYERCDVLVNSRKLGRYMQTHKTMIAAQALIVADGTTNNRQRYRVLPKVQNNGRPLNKA